METIDNLLKFIGSYPVWGRLLLLACLLVSVGTLVFAPRSVSSQGSKAAPVAAVKKAEQVFMRIRPIKLFPDNPNAEVQLSAFVNGTEYVHPSVAGVQWMKVGPNMSDKIIELPKADRYNVRFEMRIRDGARLQQRPQVSQMITPVMALPYSEEYRLYQVENNIRSAGVSALIAYDIFAQ